MHVCDCILIDLGAMQAQEPRLRYSLQAGERYSLLEIDLQQSTHSESMEREEMAFYSLSHLIFRVDSIDTKGLLS